jgi:apoptosis-inducing factor 2
MAQKKQIVIIGGSYGGVSIAHYLERHVLPALTDSTSYTVTMISSSTEFWDRPAAPRAMISDHFFPQNKLFVKTAQLFEQYPAGSFRFVHGTATKADHVKRTVEVMLADDGRSETISAHALVIATGATSSSALLGLRPGQDVEALKESWKQFREALPLAKHVVIVGGGPAGIETAGELGEHLNGKPGWFASKLENPKVQITVLTAASKILPVLRPAIAKTAIEYLAAVGVTVKTNARVVSVSGSANDIAGPAYLKLEDGTEIHADLYISATGLTPNTSFLDASLLTADKRVKTNSTTLRVEGNNIAPRIYAIGDVASTARPAILLINDAIPFLGANIKHDLQLAAGVSAQTAVPERKYKADTSETQLVPIGTKRGVGAVKGWRVPSWFVWAMKGRDYWLWTLPGLWSGKAFAKE